MPGKQSDRLIEQLGILVVDENPYTRKLTRMMLMNIGAKSICEAADGVAALDVIRTANPDVAIMEWELPVLSGSQVIKIVRSPEVFPKPHLPIVVLTSYGHRRCVHEALRLGVHEFLVKPTSPMALRNRLLSIVVKPRPMVRIGKLYVPEPRRLIQPHELMRAA
jgi:two-component system, chemotaxis family, chemotaxis protein CheY